MASRRVLVRAVLTALPIFALSVLKDKVCLLVVKGGLGILNLHRFSAALRLRWLWLVWQQPRQLWMNFLAPCDQGDRELSASATSVQVDNKLASTWLGSATLCREFPNFFKHTRRKSRTVETASANDQWIRDLHHGNTANIVNEFLQLWRKIQRAGIVLSLEEDKISWVAEGGSMYSASTAYNLQTQEASPSGIKSAVWKARAPGSVKIFAWLLHHDRLWCNDRLQQHGWPNGYFCTLCIRNQESSTHLLWDCPFSSSIWHTMSTRVGYAALKEKQEMHHGSLRHFQRLIALTPAGFKKGLKSMFLMIVWEIWKERNACIFGNKLSQTEHVLPAIRGSLELWRLPGARCLELPFGKM
ncbi:uncharacterized protein [Aegilops tauschii subsp. strangulata]|uniref:uncharacterized protein n=1 Tax=Aegilops tauschii subsp. strangulata TaxID=200361 RepID=UPI003CC8A7FC